MPSCLIFSPIFALSDNFTLTIHVMSSKKIFKPNFLVISLLGLLGILFFSHLFQSIFGITLQEEVALVILIATAILWVSEAIPLYITSLAVLFASIMWLLPILQSHGIDANKEDFFDFILWGYHIIIYGRFCAGCLNGQIRNLSNTGEANNKIHRHQSFTYFVIHNYRLSYYVHVDE